jgi:hypothetical protein
LHLFTSPKKSANVFFNLAGESLLWCAVVNSPFDKGNAALAPVADG